MTSYNEEFFNEHTPGSKQSADIVVPLILELVRPSSVVDVGCGVGTWLAAFRENGIDDILGIDGDWVSRDNLMIPRCAFASHDLTTPIQSSRRFDVALSLEVAEHLPGSAAKSFIETLTTLAPIVVFSAAIPFQGGTHHVNERWPSYWAAMFLEHGYFPADCIRPLIWSNDDVCWWYAQNMMLFVHKSVTQTNNRLRAAVEATCQTPLSLVHPRRFLIEVNALRGVPFSSGLGVPYNLGLGKVLRAIPRMIANSISSRCSRLVSRRNGERWKSE